jgi:hypothetical protein
MAHEIIERLLAAVGGKYSRELGIDLTGADPAAIFRWVGRRMPAENDPEGGR